MGNRGNLHDAHRQIVRTRSSRDDWVTCALSFNGWENRSIMTPGKYTELFFLDEATALAAGHRPCFTCRRAAFNAFKMAWIGAGLVSDGAKPVVTAIDPILRHDRMDRDGRKVTYRAPASELPDGTMLVLDVEPDTAWLLHQDRLLRWTPARYASATAVPDEVVTVLTPRSTVKVLGAGFVPEVHVSASAIQCDRGNSLEPERLGFKLIDNEHATAVASASPDRKFAVRLS